MWVKADSLSQSQFNTQRILTGFPQTKMLLQVKELCLLSGSIPLTEQSVHLLMLKDKTLQWIIYMFNCLELFRA